MARTIPGLGACAGRCGRRGRGGAGHADPLLPAGAGAPSRPSHRRVADVAQHAARTECDRAAVRDRPAARQRIFPGTVRSAGVEAASAAAGGERHGRGVPPRVSRGSRRRLGGGAAGRGARWHRRSRAAGRGGGQRRDLVRSPSRRRRRPDDPGKPCPGDRPVAARPPAHGHGAPARYAVRGNRVGRPRLRRGGVRIGALRSRGSRGEELHGALRARAVRRHRTPRKLRRFDRPRVPARARAALAAADVRARRTLRTHGARPARRRALRGRADPRERPAGQRALAAAGKPEAHDPAHRRVRAQDRRSLHHARRRRVSRHGGVGGDRRRGHRHDGAGQDRDRRPWTSAVHRRRRGVDQLRALVRADPPAARNARHQAAGDDRGGDGAPAQRAACARPSARVRRRGGQPRALAGGGDHGQPAAGRARGAGAAGNPAAARVRTSARPRSRRRLHPVAVGVERRAVLRGVHRRAALDFRGDRRLVRELGDVPPPARGGCALAPDRLAVRSGARGPRRPHHRGQRRRAWRQHLAGNPARHGARDRDVLRPAARGPARHVVHGPAGARVLVVRRGHLFAARVLVGGRGHRRDRLHESDGVVRAGAGCGHPVDGTRRGLAAASAPRRVRAGAGGAAGLPAAAKPRSPPP